MEQAHLILFDIDGTLVDSNEAILEAFRIAHKTIGREYPGDEMISSKFGKSLMPILEELKIPESDLDDFVHAFRNAELESTQFSLFGGMREVLDLVKQLTGTLAAVTSKSQVTANHVLETLNLSEEFTLVITADDVEHTKPDPQPLLKACDLLDITPGKEVIYVGDSKFDMEAVKHAGLTSIAVTWGAHGSDLIGDYTVNSPEELLELIEELLPPQFFDTNELKEDVKHFESGTRIEWFVPRKDIGNRFENLLDLLRHGTATLVTAARLIGAYETPHRIKWMEDRNENPGELSHSDIIRGYYELVKTISEQKVPSHPLFASKNQSRWRKAVSHILHHNRIIRSLGFETLD